MTTTMPADGQNQAINVLNLKRPGKGHQVPFTSSAANTSPRDFKYNFSYFYILYC